MNIFVTGTRGIPNIPGGVETHCQELYTRIAGEKHTVQLCTRASYVESKQDKYKGVRLNHLYAPAKKSLETIVHTCLSLLMAYRMRPDIVHIQGIGPSLFVPLARLMGFKVVMTHHGPEYDRQKWGGLAKWVLKAGEYLGCRFAHEVIVISSVIQKIVMRRCGKAAHLIYNGVPIPEKSSDTNHIDALGLSPGEYLLAVARFVPEKGLHDLIHAFRRNQDEFKLVIAGDADHETQYSRDLKALACSDNRIVLTGYVTGEYLNQLYSHAKLFVLPSYHEGLPIALLEALSYGLPSMVSDIPANKEVGLAKKYYFKCGSVDELETLLNDLLNTDIDAAEEQGFKSMVAHRYNWDTIAQQTLRVYEHVLAR
jgi:starch synthase